MTLNEESWWVLWIEYKQNQVTMTKVPTQPKAASGQRHWHRFLKVQLFRQPNNQILWLFHSGNHRPVRIPLEGTRALNGQHVPPLRVGDFIRTFPFNSATLRASQHKLDVKTVIQELHKLTGQLAISEKRREQEEVKKDKHVDDEEDFDSLLWGPKDPPLLSQCFKQT